MRLLAAPLKNKRENVKPAFYYKQVTPTGFALGAHASHCSPPHLGRCGRPKGLRFRRRGGP